ncbi:hypothetical protein AURDEDRAFT_169275 [Auricularia subglabra TFB-10046 SS5]|nr:hypothetical protein AURDEDRAFT_169275 [Auricularia subglabra TFB-10046 SS5]
MSNPGSKIVRSYDKSVSNRAPKQKKPRPPTDQAAKVDQPAAPSTTTASRPATNKNAETSSSKAPAGKKFKEPLPDRKVVFRSTLDTPFRVDWPAIPPARVNAFLEKFIELLASSGVAKFQASRGRRHARNPDDNKKVKEPSTKDVEDRASRKRKRWQKDTKDRDAQNTAGSERARKRQRVAEADQDAMVTDPPPQPEILSHLIIGINHVTKRLEGQREALSTAKRVVKSSALPDILSPPLPKLKYVLVCTGDIDPPALVAHIPHLVAGCNSNSTVDTVLLIPLPKGSEASLASAFGLPRCSVVGIAESASRNVLDPLSSLSSSFPIVRAPWLVVPAPPPLEDGSAMDVDPTPSRVVELIPTHVKQLRTTAPRNMGAAKQARKDARAAVRAKLILNPSPDNLRKEMAGGKPVKKNRVVVKSLPEGTAS